MGAIILFVQEDIASELLPYVNLGNAVENSLIWFQKMFSSFWFIDFISPGEFNAEMWNSHIQDFCAVFNLKNLIEKTFCFKNLEKPRGIYHILTNYTKLL